MTLAPPELRVHVTYFILLLNDVGNDRNYLWVIFVF